MLDYTYKDFQEKQGEIHFEEFTDKIWNDSISEKIVSNAYYAENEDFILALTYDCYRLFQNSNNLTIRILSRTIESLFFNLFRYKGANSDVQDTNDGA
jgi:hypothetical protein